MNINYIAEACSAIVRPLGKAFKIESDIIPTTEAEWLEVYWESNGVDDNDSIIWSNDPADFSMTWSEVEAKATELQSALPLTYLRIERNRKISETDWTQMEDIPQVTRDAWKPYRQALRDITQTYNSPEDVVWPEKPL